MKIVKSFKRGVWTAHVIDRNSPPMNHMVSESLRYMVRLDHPNGFITDWPIQYDNGSIAYGIWNCPRDGQRATRAAFKYLKGITSL